MDCRASALTLRDARPFQRHADQISILTIKTAKKPPFNDLPTGDMVTHLERHRINIPTGKSGDRRSRWPIL
jgi:hypothetical protein